jgi:hypothetical protein
MTVLLPPVGWGYLKQHSVLVWCIARNMVVTYPDPEGADGSPETLVPKLVARMSELVLPLWPVGWIVVVVNGLVIVLVTDMVNALVPMVKVGGAELGEPEAGTDGVAAAEESEIGCPGVPGTDDTGRVGMMEEPEAD